MKKYMALVLVFALAFCLIGCDEAEREKESDNKMKFETPVMVRSGEKEILPYVVTLSFMSWSKDGWLMGDAPNIDNIISEKESDFPEVIYADDFEIFYRDENISYVNAAIYDESFTGDEGFFKPYYTLSDLVTLPEGRYYLSITVNEKGEYIESEDMYERTTYGCLYRLVIK